MISPWRTLAVLAGLAHAAPAAADPTLSLAPPLTAFAPDPRHPFNQVYDLLYRHERRAEVARCLAEKTACAPATAIAGPVRTVRLAVGGDEPSLFFAGEVAHLRAPERAAALLRALGAARRIAARAPPLARLLLQNDLWERHDAIHAHLERTPADRAGLGPLQQAIAAFLPLLALSDEELARIPDNRAALEAAHPDLLAGFAAGRGWIEIASRYTEGSDPGWREGTRHALVSGFRTVFRIFLHVDDEAAMRARLAAGDHELPAGSRVLLVASPLALDRRGQPRAVPLVTLIEARQIPIEHDARRFIVLEGRRAHLTSPALPAGGLERLPPDAPLNAGASCAPNLALFVPYPATCPTCHGPAADRLTGPMSHGRTELRALDDPRFAADVVVEEKRRRPDFAALARYFSPR